MRVSDPTSRSSRKRSWFSRIGPGLIIACVVIGPGSILTSSKVGATYGYGMLWVVVVTAVFMLVYMTLGARLGVVAGAAPGTLIAVRAGRWLAVLIGVSVFLISAAYQFGNNLGVHSAFQAYVKFDYVIVVFNGLSIAFLFGFRNLYRAVERLMMAFVALMLLSFLTNLLFAQPRVASVLGGLVPGAESQLDVSVLGLVGTTFVISAAFFQVYLVRQKGWEIEQLKDGLTDARIGAAIMALITMMIMLTAATVLRGQHLKSVADVGEQLRPLFGEKGRALFCLGLFSAAYSSFLVNSMIGGFILSDGLGFGSKPEDLGPRIFTLAVLLTGMFVAMLVIKTGWNPVPAIVAAQAATVLAAPLVAGVLWWLTSRGDVMGDLKNGPLLNVAAGVGFALILAMAGYTALVEIPNRVEKYREGQTKGASPGASSQVESYPQTVLVRG